MELYTEKQPFFSFLILFILLCPSCYSELEKFNNISAAIPVVGSGGGNIKLRIGIPVTEKNGIHQEFVNLVRDPQTNITIVKGFCIDVFKAAMDTLTVEVPYEFIPFQDARGQMAGSYNDLIDQVYFQNYDSVVGDTTITANRSLYVDFTLPYTEMGVAMIVPKAQNDNTWIFLKPLKPDLWLSSAALFVFTGFVVWIIERPTNDEFQGSQSQQIGMIFWYSFSTLVYAHREKLVSNLSKFVVIVWLFVVLILSSSYTATLASMLTVQHIKMATTSNDYVGIHYLSIVPAGASSNLDFEAYRRRSYKFPEEVAKALSKGSKNGGVSAIIDEIPYLKAFLAKYPGPYTMTAPQYITSGFGFVFQKGSPLVHNISRGIAKLREEGTLAKIENEWLFNNRHHQSSFVQEEEDSTSNPSSLSLVNFGGLFLITASTSTLALAIFLVPSVYKRIYERLGLVKEYFIVTVSRVKNLM